MGDVSRHFDKSEFACKCCGFNPIASEQFVIAEIVREFEGGEPYTLNSACRCREYNEKVQMKYVPGYVPGTSKSKHMNGLAVDYPSKNPKVLYKHLNKLFPATFGIGLYKTFVHVDIRQNKVRW